MVKKNEEITTIPVYVLEKLLESYYFKQACKYYNVESWEKYKDVLLYQKQLAVNDIMKVNKE